MIVFTCSPDAQAYALQDLSRVDPGATLARWLDPGIGLAQPKTRQFEELGDAIRAAHAPFIRHLAPATRIVELDGSERDVDAICAAAQGMAASMRPDVPFSVQVRYTGATHQVFDAATLSREIAEPLLATGAPQDVRHPGQIFSVLCHGTKAYLGFSTPRQNLSSWAGGAQRFRQESDQISRAEFKLLEAFDVFSLKLPLRGVALDLGASPGGWTRVLRQRSLNVIAVDPADLAAPLLQDRGVRHERMWAQRYLDMPHELVDMLVNDMRMDALESARVMLQAHKALKRGGVFVMTLKLPARGAPAVVAKTLDLLQPAYKILGVRQLHHNRSEATVVGEGA